MANRGKCQRDRGNRFEAKCVAIAKAHRLSAQRVPLSGSAGGAFSGDIQIEAYRVLNGECKKRATGFTEIYRWLGDDHDFLVIGRDRSKPLAVIDYEFFLTLLQVAQP